MVFEQVPGCSHEMVQKLDERIDATNGEMNDKVKRELIRKVLRPIIAVSYCYFY